MAGDETVMASSSTGHDDARERRRHRRWIAAAFGLAFLLRLGFAFFYWANEPLTRDEREYLSLARSLAAGNGFIYDAEVMDGSVQPFGRAPGYPVFLAVTGGGARFVDSVPLSVKIAQALVGSAGILLVAALAGRLAGSRAAVAGALIAACYPPLVWIASYAFSEAIFWPIALLVAWGLDRIESARSRIFAAFGSGLLTGVAILIRPATMAFVPIAAVWFLVRRRYLGAAGFLIGMALLIGPWTVRNHAHYGRFVPVAAEGGVTF